MEESNDLDTEQTKNRKKKKKMLTWFLTETTDELRKRSLVWRTSIYT